MKIFNKATKIAFDMYVNRPKIKGHMYHTAILFRRNTPVAIGINQYQTDPKVIQIASSCGLDIDYAFIHAEINALTKIDDYHGLKMVVVRINTKGLAISKPCKNCQMILEGLQIPYFYSTRDGYEGW